MQHNTFNTSFRLHTTLKGGGGEGAAAKRLVIRANNFVNDSSSRITSLELGFSPSLVLQNRQRNNKHKTSSRY